MVAVGQTVTIVNKSGKVVSTSKHLVNVFNEAKSAYHERKAELKARRRGDEERKSEEGKARKRLEALDMDDDDDKSSRRSSRRGSEDGHSRRRKHRTESRRERPPFERGVSDSFYTSDRSSRDHRRSSHKPSPLNQEVDEDPRMGELVRRHTDMDMISQRRRSHRDSRSPPSRAASLDDIDMDLAYGELPPPLPERKYDTEIELRQKMTALQRMLEEANCLQYSVAAMIDNLHKNPDAMAAVALTLAEVSNLAAKMAPGALASMKGAFPAIVALLASPQFAIAAGVGVGVTIIAFGSYKIIKKIKAKRDSDENLLEPGTPDSEAEMDSLRELNGIERWRRGIADVEASSVGTSVDGEFVTPGAKVALIEDGKLTEADLKSEDGKKKKKKKLKHTRSKSEKDSSSSKSKSKSEKPEKKKELSGLKMLFKSQRTDSLMRKEAEKYNSEVV